MFSSVAFILKRKLLQMVSIFFPFLLQKKNIYYIQEFVFWIFNLKKFWIFAEFEDSYFGVFISPKVFLTKKREIVIYWNHTNYQRGDKIGLYSEKPGDEAKPIYIFEIFSSSGIEKTKIEADLIPSRDLKFVKQCLSKYYFFLEDYVNFNICFLLKLSFINFVLLFKKIQFYYINIIIYILHQIINF